jgi:RNA polymerase sigma-70 factor (ECF subfamily)
MPESAGGDQDLAAALEAMHRIGSASWSTVAISVDEFARHLAICAGEPLTASWLYGRPAADLYLACACAHRVPAALAAFDEHYLSHVRSFVAHMRPDAEFVDECRQVLREKLFVGAAAKIAEYTGRGSLLGWLRVATARTALNIRRSRAASFTGTQRAAQPAAAEPIDGPERSYLQDHYREAFKAAIEDSFAVLSSEQRNLLRMHFMDGMTLHQLATLFQVHRATVARWIAQTRRRVLDGTRTHLQQQLALPTAELDSMMRLLDSQLELSIRHLLAPDDDSPDATPPEMTPWRGERT